MLELGVKALLAYLLGSLSGSLLVGRLYGGVDIRDAGSGNAGGTNALRTQGVWFALLVVIIDIGKGALAVSVIPALAIVAPDPYVARDWLAVACGGAAVIGHIWPFWYDFRGGKGGGTLIGAYAVLAWPVLPLALLVWLLIVTSTGYVGLATMIAATSAIAGCALFSAGQNALLVFSIAMAALVVFAHRINIQRMRAGQENRMRKAMFWRRTRD